MKHPSQPIEFAKDGCIRFKSNKIVNKMLDICTKHGYSLNEIAVEFYEDEDYIQLMQLIGYSVSGCGDLNCVSSKEVKRVDKIADRLIKGKQDV